MTTLRLASGGAFTLLLAAGSVGACSSEDRPPASASSSASSSTGGPGGDGSATGEGGDADGSTITPRPDLCMGVTLTSEAILEVNGAGEAPMPLGGKVIPGTYDLAELYVYGGSSSGGDGGEPPPSGTLTGQGARVTILVTEFAMQFVEVRGASDGDAGVVGAEKARAVLYRAEDKSLFFTPVCPATGGPAPFSYTAVGGGLVIYPDAKHREVYQRR